MKQKISAVYTWLSDLSARFRGSEDVPDPESEFLLDFRETEDYRSGEFLNSLEQLTEADVPL
ncbi:MAG: hypothetical protein IJB15_08530, partial [Clostridia bacterium]|nr:hypothetical protein [Clostridia bacterium]